MCSIFVCGFCCHVGRIVNYVTKVATKNMDKKASKIGILINASSLIPNECERSYLSVSLRFLLSVEMTSVESFARGSFI